MPALSPVSSESIRSRGFEAKESPAWRQGPRGARDDHHTAELRRKPARRPGPAGPAGPGAPFYKCLGLRVLGLLPWRLKGRPSLS